MPLSNDLTTIEGCHAEIRDLRQSEEWAFSQIAKQGTAVGAAWEAVNKSLLEENKRLCAEIDRLRAKAACHEST